jgi:hypothetical protein
MEPNAGATNLGQGEQASIYDRAITVLREGKTVVAPLPLKTGKARCLICCYATEERLEGALKPQDNILQHMGVNLTELWTRRFESRQLGLLLVVTSANTLSAFPLACALLRGNMVEHATPPQCDSQRLRLFRCRVKPILIGFTDALLFHCTSFRLTDVRPEAGISSPAGDNTFDPIPKVRGMWAFLLILTLRTKHAQVARARSLRC